MATKSEATKMNVRSPFYVIADGEGKPESIGSDFNQAVDTPTDQPDVYGNYTNSNLPDQPAAYVLSSPDGNTGATSGPSPYVQPETFQETVFSGDVVNIGEDVGIRVFEFDTDDLVGDITIDFEVTTPVKIRAFWNGGAIDYGNGGYIGDSSYDAALTEAGVAAGDRQLGSRDGTSTTQLTIGTGSATLTTQGGLSFVTGQSIVIQENGNPANYMVGEVTSYNTTTGSLGVNVTSTGGSGTISNWTVESGNGISTTSLTVGTGTKSLTTQTGLSFSAGQFITIKENGNTSNYMAGRVTSYNSSTGALEVNITNTGGSGTASNWTVESGGGTSTTELTIGTGSRTLTTQTGLSFVTGQSVVIQENGDAANYMIGEVSTYNSATGALEVNVTSIGGSGTASNWTVGRESGTQTGTIIVTKDEATDPKRFVTVVVTAPLINDSYKLTFGGGSVPGALTTLPATPDGTTFAYTFPIFHLQSQPGQTARPSLTVNGIKVVDSMAEDTVYTFHDNPEIGPFRYRAGENLTTVNIDRSTYFHPGINYIDIETPGDFSLYGGQHDYTYYWGVSGIFHDGSDWEFPLIADKGKYGWEYYTVSTSGNNWQIGATQKVFHQDKPIINRLVWYIRNTGTGYPIRWNTSKLEVGPTKFPEFPAWTHFVGSKSALTDGGGTSKSLGSIYS